MFTQKLGRRWLTGGLMIAAAAFPCAALAAPAREDPHKQTCARQPQQRPHLQSCSGPRQTEPDAQEVEYAQSGSLLDGRARVSDPPAGPFCPPTETACNTLQPGVSHVPARKTAEEKRGAALVTASAANAMQAAAVAHGEANSALSNPYIEQKVTTPESVGVNATGVPAGGF